MPAKSQEDVNQITHKIIGCAMQVYNKLGTGFQEVIYQRSLAIEMKLAGMRFEREKEISIFYKDELVGSRRVDFFIENCVMLEIKAVDTINDLHKTQAINYLEAYNLPDGLLINFGGTSLEFKRIYNKRLVKPKSKP